MAKFRKKLVVIEAFQIQPDHWSNPPSWPEWFYEATQKPPGADGKAFMGDMDENGLATVIIITLEGGMTGRIGDWIIRGVKGELYPYKSDIFEATYEHVEGGVGEV